MSNVASSTISEYSEIVEDITQLIDQQDQITIANNISPFWNNNCASLSQQLWLPTFNESVDEDPVNKENYFKDIFNRFSWMFPTVTRPLNLHFPPSQVFPVNDEMTNMVTEASHKTKKYRIYFPKKKKESIITKLNDYFGYYRWYCNFTLDVITTLSHFVRDNLEIKQEIINFYDNMLQNLQEELNQQIQTIEYNGKDSTLKANYKAQKRLLKANYKIQEKEIITRKYNNLEEYFSYYKLCVGGKLNYRKVEDYMKRCDLTVCEYNGKRINRFTYTGQNGKLPRPAWMPKDKLQRVLRGAIEKTVQSVNSAISNLVNGNITHFEMKRKTKKDNFQVLHFSDTDIPAFIKHLIFIRRKGRKIIKDKPIFSSGMEIIHDKLSNKYYLTTPVKLNNVECSNENQVSLDNCIVFDEGVRGMETGYVPNKMTIEFGNTNECLYRRMKKCDNLRSLATKTKNKDLYIKIAKINRKLHNMIKDYHWKIAHYLTSKFETIIMPVFPVKNIAAALGNNHKSRRLLYLYSHYSFKQRLGFKCYERGNKFFTVQEPYTSKTCGNCGQMYSERSKIYSCPSCGIKIDRDINAARNILLRTFS